MIYTFVIPGPSVPQGSARAFVVAGRARVTSANKGLAAWRSHAVRCIHEQECPPEPLTGALAVHVTDYRVRPKSCPKKRLWPETQPDLDKIVRACLDALEASGLFRNDGQVCSLSAEKVFADRPAVKIEVWRLRED